MLSNAIDAYKQTKNYAAHPIFIAEPVVSIIYSLQFMHIIAITNL